MTTFKSFDDVLEHFLLMGFTSSRRTSESFVNSNRKRVDVIFPIAPIRSKSQKCLRIVGGNNYLESLNQILYETIFGQPRVFQWLILFELLNSTKKYSAPAQALYDVIVVLSGSSRNLGSPEQQMNANMVSVRQICGKEVSNNIAEVLRLAGIKVPYNRSWASDSIKVVKYTRHFKSPIEPMRIGVGYKDKGHLPLPGSEYDPDPGLLSDSHCPVKLWEKFRNMSKIPRNIKI